MARALDQIIQELSAVYDPQRQGINKQIASLDPAQQSEQQGLDAAKSDSFQQITDQANRRGLFYSGMPVAEEQKYTGASYLPAVANLKNRYAQQRFSLQDALNGITKDQYSQAYGIRQGELNSEAQLAAARASAGSGASAYSPSFGYGGGGGGQVQGANTNGFTAQQRAGGGFNFQGPGGQAISAAQYASNMGIPYRTLLQTMAQAGDAGAQTALGLVGNDGGFNRTKITSQNQVNLLKALGFNTGGFTYAAPVQKTTLSQQLASKAPAQTNQLAGAKQTQRIGF